MAAAIILAGGASTRMGDEKSLLPYRGVPMIQYIADQLRPLFGDLLVSANNPAKYAFLGLEVVPDRLEGEGPLMGIASALAVSVSDLNFVVACDIPELPLDLMRRMLEAAEAYDCVVPVSGPGRYEPLFAVYRRDVLPQIEALLEEGERTVHALFERCNTETIAIEPGTLMNVNTRADYESLTQNERQ